MRLPIPHLKYTLLKAGRVYKISPATPAKKIEQNRGALTDSPPETSFFKGWRRVQDFSGYFDLAVAGQILHKPQAVRRSCEIPWSSVP